MDNNNENLEFDLESILNEFHDDNPEAANPELAEEEPLSAMPELTVSSEAEQDAELAMLLAEEAPALTDDTKAFKIVKTA